MKFLTTLLLMGVSISLFAQTPGPHQMLNLNGTSTYVECGTIDLGGSALTMESWIRVDAFKGAFPFISSVMGTEAPGTSAAMLRLGDASLANNLFQFVLRINGNQEKLDAVTPLAANRWYHVACTYDGTEMKIYINGMLDVSASVTGPISSNDVFALGRNYGNDRVLDGKMDESRVWTTALSQGEIRDWMCKKVTSSHPSYANLEGYWRMDEGTGTTTADYTANNNDGTFVGAPTWQTSSAPIGDESVHDYSSPFSTSLAHPSGGVFLGETSDNDAELIHVYRVDEMPNDIALPAGTDTAQTGHYWGVFSAGTTGNIDVDYAYAYLGVPLFLPGFDCNAGFLARSNAAVSPWTQAVGTANDPVNDILSNSVNRRAEIWLSRSDSFELAASGPLDICNGDTVTFYPATALSFPIDSANWYNGGSLITGATDTLYTATDSGVYSARFLTSSGCVINYLPMQVNTDPGLVQISGIGPFCEEDSPVALTSGSPGPGYYEVNGVSNAQFSPSQVGAGTHTLTYFAFGMNLNCTDSAETMVIVNPSPVITYDLDTSICEGETVAINSAIPSGGAYTGTGVSGNDFNSAMTGAGSFSVVYTVVSAEGCTASDSGTVTVNFTPNPPIISATGTQLVASKTSGIQWYFEGTLIDGATDTKLTPSQNGMHQATYTDTNGCTSALSDPITFVGLAEGPGKYNVKAFPNPVKNILTIASDQMVDQVELIDMQGRVVATHQPMVNRYEMDLSAFAPGHYLLRLEVADDRLVRSIVITP